MKTTTTFQTNNDDNKDIDLSPIRKGWVVERTFSWIDNCQRLCRNYGLTFDSQEMAKIAS